LPACTSRPYADAHDLDSILALLHRVRAPERCTDYPAPADLRELLAVPDIQANTRLWETEAGQLRAFALVDTYHNLLFEFEGDIAGPDLPAELIQWGVTCRRRQPTEEGEPVTLDFCCRADDEERLALLTRHGFTQQPTRTLRLKRSLHDPIPEPVLPAGFTLRPTTGQDEVEAWVALHRAAWGTEHMTVEGRSAMLSGPDYDPELDLVVVAPEGRLAAYCVCWISQEENARTGRKEGYTDPVATHPDYQQRGLARALLLTGLRLLQARGMETAVMGTSSENERMLRAATAVGFQVVSTGVWLAKPVE